MSRVRCSPRFRPALENLEGRFAPATLAVNSVADNTTADGALTLREAVAVVNGTLGRSLTSAERAQVTGTLGVNDTIQFSLPAGPQTITLTGGALSITRALSLNGPGAGSLTLSGNNRDRVFYVGQGFSQNLGLRVAISGLTITGGSQAYGAGLFNSGTLAVSNTTFASNTATVNGGGGLYNNGALTLTACTFSSNSTHGSGSSSSAGGGLYNTGAGTATVSGCTFAGNTATGSGSSASSGGGVSNSGTMTVNNSTFTGNKAASDGAGIYNDAALTISNTSFINNASFADGGGIRSGGTTLTLNNSSFYGNSASSQGGGLSSSDTALAVTNCTFVNNTAGSQAGAIEAEPIGGKGTLTNTTITGNRATTGSSSLYGGGIANDRPLKLLNTLVAGNFQGPAPGTRASDVAGTLDPGSAFNLIGTGGGGGLVNGVNNNQVGVSNPGLGPVAGNGGPTQTVLLLPGSPAIDHGSNAYVTTGETDQRGLSRLVNGTVDVGAVEVQTTSTPPGDQNSAAGVTTPFNLGSFADANQVASPWRVDVNWGDNSGDTLFTTNVLGVLASQTHAYQANGTDTVTVTVTDGDNDSSKAAFHVNVLATVIPGASNFTVAGFPSPITAGAAGTFTVTARDAQGNLATGYRGTVHFTSSDSQVVLPADYAFTSADNGVHTFSATLNTAGTQSLTATDTVTPSITGTQAGIVVNPAAGNTLTLTGFPSPATAGVAAAFTVTVRDAQGNLATGYQGTVHFTSSDSQAALPADYTFTSADNGVHTFSATLKTAGTQALTATDTASSISSTQAGIVVNPAAANIFIVAGFPSPTAAGMSGKFTVTARDGYGNLATGYRGTAHFTSSDSQAALPADYAFTSADNGVHTFGATLNTAGTQSLTAADTVTASLTGTQSGIVVDSAPPNTTVLTVNSAADNTTADGVLTLREAIAVVDGTLGRPLTPGEQAQVSGTGTTRTIQFNLPGGPQAITLTGGALGITSPVTISGPGAGSLTVNGNNQDRVFVVGQIYTQNLGLVVAISGLTIAGGNQQYGAGLLNFGTLTVTNSTFSGNTATVNGGAGIFNDGALTLTGCTVTGNTTHGSGSSSSAGGGLYNTGSGTVTVSNCTFSNNTATGSGSGASSGAGIYNSGTLTVTGSTFTGNSAASSGGGIDNSGSMTVSTTTFASNSASSDGGGIQNDGTLTVNSSTFSGNSASSEGGGINTNGTVPGVNNSTFYGNTAGSEGGGLCGSGSLQMVNCTITANRVLTGSGGVFGGGLFAGRPAKLFNTLVAGNFQGPAPSTVANDVAGSLDSSSAFNLIGTGGGGGLVNGVNNNQVGVSNPGLGLLASNGGPTQTVLLLPGSPALDSGSNAYVSAGETDQRGLARIVNGTVDIGAVEMQTN
jgi:hypothetical protein